ncbi:MAG: hypothetical protein PHX80_04695 [Candidatus Nanoarchaeia archaeon]|nr:hypothetical protein [Candidatus Nanoarchaeia archaeon]
MRNLPQKRQEANIYNYIACKNPSEAWKLLKTEDIDVPKSKPHVALALAEYANKNGEVALEKIAQIHPDKELILKYAKEEKSEKQPDIMKSAEGEGKKFNLNPNTINILIVAGATVFTLTSIVLLVRAAK